MSSEELFEIQSLPQAIVIRIARPSLDELTTQALESEVANLAAAAAQRPFILDLAAVEFAPSVAIGVLIKMLRSFKLDGQRFVLAGVQRRVQRVMEVTRVSTLFEVFPTVSDALAASGK